MKTKHCKYCWKEIPKWLANVCSIKCLKKWQEQKEKERKKIAREKKSVSISVLTIKADKIFSEYIRKRDALKTTWSLEKCVCITCWELKDYSQFDCWHFISRSSRSTRWEEKNCNAQCKVCNNWWSGRQYEHGKAIDRKYWEWTADLLVRLGNEPQKVTREFLQEIIRKYTDKLELLTTNI